VGNINYVQDVRYSSVKGEVRANLDVLKTSSIIKLWDIRWQVILGCRLSCCDVEVPWTN